jgi:leucyl-tRNA synthetase
MRALERKLHQTILKVTDDIQNFRFNTAIAALMELNNYLYKVRETMLRTAPLWNQTVRDLVLMMAPIFPHIADELWHRQGNTSSVHKQRWPVGDPEKAREEEITVVVQINGKVRDKLVVAPGTSGAELEQRGAATEQRRQMAGWTTPTQGDRRAGQAGQHRGRIDFCRVDGLQT